MLHVNTRILNKRTTGVQRYLMGLLKEFEVLGVDFVSHTPSRALSTGYFGHAWEQSVLPLLASQGILWSPSNIGPLFYKRQVVTIHDVVPLDHPEWLSPKFAHWYKFALPILLKNCSKIISISEFTKQRILHHFPDLYDKIKVVPNGFDTTFNVKSIDDFVDISLKFGINYKRYFISVSSIEPRKNLRNLIEAWKCVKDELPCDIQMVIVGASGDPLIFSNYNLPLNVDRIIYSGYLPDYMLPILYSGAIATMYPSFYEGFGLPVVESLACGTPVIVANNSAPAEVVGSSGFLVDPYCVKSISDSILSMYESHSIFSLSSCVDQANSFTLRKCAEQTMQILVAER